MGVGVAGGTEIVTVTNDVTGGCAGWGPSSGSAILFGRHRAQSGPAQGALNADRQTSYQYWAKSAGDASVKLTWCFFTHKLMFQQCASLGHPCPLSHGPSPGDVSGGVYHRTAIVDLQGMKYGRLKGYWPCASVAMRPRPTMLEHSLCSILIV